MAWLVNKQKEPQNDSQFCRLAKSISWRTLMAALQEPRINTSSISRIRC